MINDEGMTEAAIPLLAEIVRLRSALTSIAATACPDVIEYGWDDCRTESPDQRDEWCGSCLAKQVLEEEK